MEAGNSKRIPQADVGWRYTSAVEQLLENLQDQFVDPLLFLVTGTGIVVSITQMRNRVRSTPTKKFTGVLRANERDDGPKRAQVPRLPSGLEVNFLAPKRSSSDEVKRCTNKRTFVSRKFNKFTKRYLNRKIFEKFRYIDELQELLRSSTLKHSYQTKVYIVRKIQRLRIFTRYSYYRNFGEFSSVKLHGKTRENFPKTREFSFQNADNTKKSFLPKRLVHRKSVISIVVSKVVGSSSDGGGGGAGGSCNHAPTRMVPEVVNVVECDWEYSD
ncbi:hypothetical protein WN51_04583 [Melipona quadrifasciata]|uniref:Uncharacterized protein n=1 Tax=Melipona quadrifasciata TaxID=166423 RepID=A0A0M8ZU65_9HYME|nr:hypothetical protein WN51_04583 [Melipona quadrifasciata]